MTRTKPNEAIVPLTLLIGPGLRPQEVAVILALFRGTRSGRGPWSSTDGLETVQGPLGLELADLGQLLTWNLEQLTWSPIRISLGLSELESEPSGVLVGKTSGMRGDQGFEPEAPVSAARPGILLLDADLVPTEDIGIVRRFLESHPHWKLLLLGTKRNENGSHGLGQLPRTTALPWPPDLDQLARLAAPQAVPGADSFVPQAKRGVPMETAPERAPEAPLDPASSALASLPGTSTKASQEEPLEQSHPAAPGTDLGASSEFLDPFSSLGSPSKISSGTSEELDQPALESPESESFELESPDFESPERDAQEQQMPLSPTAGPEPSFAPGVVFTELGGLVEELLAGDALTVSDSPRYLFRSEGIYPVIGDRRDLASSLGGLLGLARHAAGARGVVSVLVGPLADGHGVLLRVDFPPGELRDSGVEELLQRAAEGPQDPMDLFGRALGEAARAAAQLRGTGAEPSLSGLEDGRLRLAVEFPPLPARFSATEAEESDSVRMTPLEMGESNSSGESASLEAPSGGANQP